MNVLGGLVNNFLQVTMLYDCYQELLTKRQRSLFESYYHENLSLREVGEVYKITPQAARDNIKRTEKLLFNYEQKLSILKKYEIKKEIAYALISEINNLTVNENKQKALIKKVELLL